ncbi:Manganese transport protein MntH [Candidatus Paraburkholderia calva]|nr:Manganese transport protein MntH [Candidatus Paraburkholderia calva]
MRHSRCTAARADDPDDPNEAPRPSLPEAYASIRVPSSGGWVRRFLAFAGPGYMISVGYMDPGNWATDIAGGSRFGYTLLSVILISNLIAVLLQVLAVRLGVATGRDLAQACRDHYSKPVNLALWLACEAAIVACDLAEVIGTAIALQLLFGLPLIAGALLTALDAFLLLLLLNRDFRLLAAFVIALLAVIAVCFLLQIAAASPPWAAVLRGFVPLPHIVTNRDMLYVAIGILGATVMPHNLYLHSSVVQTRAYGESVPARREAIRWATLDSTLALTLVLFVNAAILILAVAVFHARGHAEVAEIGDAFHLLSLLLGFGLASTLFAVALLASGLNSTVTATLAGQIVMEGFLRLRIPRWGDASLRVRSSSCR